MEGKKSAALLLPLAVGAYVGTASAATFTVNNSTGTNATTTSVKNTELKALRRGVSLQASAGVILQVGDEDATGIPNNELGATACHDGGNTEYLTTSGGGGVLQGNTGLNSCTKGKIDFQT